MQPYGSKHFAHRPPYLHPSPPPPPPKLKIQLFQNIVILHIKLTANTKWSNIVANVCSQNLLHYPRGWGQNQLFQNMVMLDIKKLRALRVYFRPPMRPDNEMRFLPNFSD